MKHSLGLNAALDLNRPRLARRALWTMLRHVCHAAALAHLAFLLLFASLGMSMLIWTNVASIALFIFSGVMLTRRRNKIALSLIIGEIMVHAVTASLLVGWDSGFHYYLLTIIGPLAVGMKGTTRSKLVRILAFGILYVALDSWTRQVPAVYQLQPALLDAIRYLNLAGMIAIMAFVSLTYARLITAAESALKTLASTDPLTGLYNRRHLLEAIEAERARGPGAGMYVLVCDIDHFKHVNDKYGHEMGDSVLREVAGALTRLVRPTDLVARWGGEEFVVIICKVDRSRALQSAERIRCAIEALQMQLPFPVTMTIGAAHVHPAFTIDAALARADAALYCGKVAGRNRVIPESLETGLSGA